MAQMQNAARQAYTQATADSDCANLFGGLGNMLNTLGTTNIDVVSPNDTLLASSGPIAGAYSINMQRGGIAFALIIVQVSLRFRRPARFRKPMLTEMNHIAFLTILTLVTTFPVRLAREPQNPVLAINSAVGTSPSVLYTGLHIPTVVLEGSGFTSDSVVTVNNVPAPTVLALPELLVAIPDSFLKSPGVIHLSVTNPPPGGGVSESVSMTVLQSSAQADFRIRFSKNEVGDNDSVEIKGTIKNTSRNTYWIPKPFKPPLSGWFYTYSLEFREAGQQLFKPLFVAPIDELLSGSEHDYARSGKIALLGVGQTYTLSTQLSAKDILYAARRFGLKELKGALDFRVVYVPTAKSEPYFRFPILSTPVQSNTVQLVFK
jgi:hypothetical protein